MRDSEMSSVCIWHHGGHWVVRALGTEEAGPSGLWSEWEMRKRGLQMRTALSGRQVWTGRRWWQLERDGGVCKPGRHENYSVLMTVVQQRGRPKSRRKKG